MKSTEYESFLADEVNKVKGIYYPVKAGLLRRALIRKAAYHGKEKFPMIRIPPAEMTVERISLMRSDRGKHGMIYTELGV